MLSVRWVLAFTRTGQPATHGPTAGPVGVFDHFQDFRLAIAMDVLGVGSQGVAIAERFGSQVVPGPTSSRFGPTQSLVMPS
jgi:hypothetical protein